MMYMRALLPTRRQVSQVGKVPIPESTLVRPPDIEHITTGFQPMSKLIDRVTQECFKRTGRSH